MNEITISTRGAKTRYRPGEVIEGSVNWNLGAISQSIQIRLRWGTRGIGTTDASVVDFNTVATPVAMGDAPFRFTLPDGPHSFSGQLIAVVWCIEVVALAARGRDENTSQFEFELSPFDAPIVLPKIDNPSSSLDSKLKARFFKSADKRGFDPSRK